ncbi:hypothetical protein ISF_05165 [Cordyceps fumosorosea ARSEF 2679]|uniref:CAS1 appressorium specific protein n=1 Tax=Cordyceps fumosorosea (strain ARSEF 2679) TaxID=1081104 RepID=A0A167V2E8_CORFA|nr:hypothetical protein ISF_05165 [Cordyceps fumosorosea ARSEF 2679]OAA62156.1 hypothetical protein ISF_05165 [Cordyceps fumosorosea ARSEF 2679]
MAPVKSIIAASVLMAAQLVSGHAAITNAVGNAGGSGMALGIESTTPRDGTRRNPFQQDATRFRGASAQTFGETVGQGANQLEAGTSKIMAETGDSLPQVTPGGALTMTLHQVNADGAGPYTCMINADGSGTTWDNIQVTQNVAGNQRGRNNDGNASDHPLVAAIPANQQCSGTVAGENNVCLVRCQNPANAGPFGGVVPVQMAAAGGAAPGAAPAAGNGAVPAAGTGAGAVPAAGTGAGAAAPAAGTGAGAAAPAAGTGAGGAAPAAGTGAGAAAPAAGTGAGGNNAIVGNPAAGNPNAAVPATGNANGLVGGTPAAGNAQQQTGNGRGNGRDNGRGQNNNDNNDKRRAIEFTA